ncbi:MAG: hypothetical protein ABI548_21140 [Polyangiaceae bacterium]
MFVRNLVKLSLLGALAIPSAFSLTACGNGSEVKHATVKAGEMPAGGEWQGVFYSPVYGYLHVLADGKTVQGAWRTGGGDAYGELQGEADGNLMKYTWTQHKIGMVGAEANSSGKGYFVYSIPKAGEAHKISGEWGLGDSDAGNTWEAIKQTNMQPNLDSVKPDEIEGKVNNAGGWDDDNKGGDDKGSKKKSDGDAPSEP